jgi:hypothetical protein
MSPAGAPPGRVEVAVVGAGPAELSVTTHPQVLPASPGSDRLIVLGTPEGRVANSAVLTDVRPRYAPDQRAPLAGSTVTPTRKADVREEIARLHEVSPADLEGLTSVTVPAAQPAALPPLQLRRPVELGEGLHVCGDHRDTPSVQGAMAGGGRAARAVLRSLRPFPAPTGAA